MQFIMLLIAMLAGLVCGSQCCPGSHLPGQDKADSMSDTWTTPDVVNESTPSAIPSEPPADVHPPVDVVLETTKGNIVLEVHPDWAPLGCARFVELVNAHYYDGAPWFRVIDGFVAQCGIAADPDVNAAWAEKTFPDEPVLAGNKPGYVAFGKTGAPDSRTTHIYINYVDNSRSLDPQGFCCFARVSEGMDVAQSLARVQDNDQSALAQPGGLEAFKARYPDADYIIRAYVRE